MRILAKHMLLAASTLSSVPVAADPVDVEFCAILKDPERYGGAEVRTEAFVLSPHVEKLVLWDPSCPDDEIALNEIEGEDILAPELLFGDGTQGNWATMTGTIFFRSQRSGGRVMRLLTLERGRVLAADARVVPEPSRRRPPRRK